MNEETQKSEKERPEPTKDSVILAWGLVKEENFSKEVLESQKKLTEQQESVHKSTHADLMHLSVQWFSERDLPNTYIDDAFRRISLFGNLRDLPDETYTDTHGREKKIITRGEINELIYEMLMETQRRLIENWWITKEDIRNIDDESIKWFQDIIRAYHSPIEDREDRPTLDNIRTFWRQFARTLKEKRKTTETK